MTTRTLITGAAVTCAIGLATIAAPALASPATPHIPATTTLTTEHTQSSGRQSIPVPVAASGTGLTRVIRTASGPKVTGGIGSIASVTVSCHAGEVAVGGGGEPADGNWAILLSRPENSTSGTTGTPTQWRVDFGNYHDTTSTGAIPTAYAVCENG